MDLWLTEIYEPGMLIKEALKTLTPTGMSLSLVVQWLRCHAANSGARVLFLVRELRFHILFSATER